MTADEGDHNHMLRLHYQRTVIGYHGCDGGVADAILFQGSAFRPSENDYDWLGSGIYFWEYGPERAMNWATETAQRHIERIQHPDVIGAVIHLGNCFDLLDLRFTEFLGRAFRSFSAAISEAGLPMPQNKGTHGTSTNRLVRKLDCAVINWAIAAAEADGLPPFDTVRGVFQEGEPAFPGSEIRARSHVQIAIRRPECILGVFRPIIDSQHNSGSLHA